MDYEERHPEDPRIASAVELMFHLSGYLPGHTRERLVPNGRMNLVIELDGRPRHIFDNESGRILQTVQGAWLSGVHSRYLTIGDLDEESRLVAVQFAIGGSSPFTDRPAHTFVDRVVQAEAVFGESVLLLREKLLALEVAAARLEVVEQWLIENHDDERSTPRLVQSVIDELLERPGELRLTELVESKGEASYRHFVEQFRYQVGPTPKRMQRILRFASIFQMVGQDHAVDWAALSLELGFSDQSHLIREFHAFSGYRPQEFRRIETDRQNFFPED